MKQSTRLFPAEVRQAMVTTGSSLTCLPVQMDAGDWETAVFFQLRGPESQHDLQRLSVLRTVPIALDTDVIEHENAAVAVFRLEVFADAEDPLAGEILLIPGGNRVHFEALELLTRQPRLGCFIGNSQFQVILAQYLRLSDSEHSEFKRVLDQAAKHDAVVRMTGRYDADSAFAAVTANYALRQEGGD
ncbi:MAG: hypothetical protein OET44_03355 [Gammaproteobacteria bacterium]|nr:hypothetical protein [Gammaproteobacteria bacterium]